MAITQNNNGSEVASIINQALEEAGSGVVIGDESGSSASGKLNEVFGDDVLDDSQSGSEWSQAVEDGFDGLEPQPSIDALVKFLHASDPHGYATATTQAKAMLANDNDLAFLFVTGDMTAYSSNNISEGLASDFAAIGDKLLMLAGNHDTYDNRFSASASSQQATTDYIKGLLGNRVIWGDPTGVASYWHKDIQLAENAKLRIISLDQYETTALAAQRGQSLNNGKYYTLYTQAQVNWLIARLKELTANDYLIVATHEPPVQSPNGTNDSTTPDNYAVGLRPTTPYFTNGELSEPKKLFVSEGLSAFGNRYDEPNLNLLPRIMNAYLNKHRLVMTYNNKGGSSSNPDITIDETFSGKPATFLFYIGGHRHCDICTYLPNESVATDGGDFSDQLMLYITCGDKNISYQYDDDLGGTGSAVTPTPTNTDTYRLNEVTLDFGEQTIKVKRYGAKNTAGGRVRDEITFPFVKEGGTT